jgi:hypothetical protein
LLVIPNQRLTIRLQACGYWNSPSRHCDDGRSGKISDFRRLFQNRFRMAQNEIRKKDNHEIEHEHQDWAIYHASEPARVPVETAGDYPEYCNGCQPTALDGARDLDERQQAKHPVHRL